MTLASPPNGSAPRRPGTPPSTREFYDRLADHYHLVYADWEASIERQGAALRRILQAKWPQPVKTVLDAACGIGTQSLALARAGFRVTASDLSPGAIERAQREAEERGLELAFAVADMRFLSEVHRGTFDLVLAADNAITHLLDETEISRTFQQFYRCTRPGGGCLISVRDYSQLPTEGVHFEPHGVREVDGGRQVLFQVWKFDGSIYETSLYRVTDGGDGVCQTEVGRALYHAIAIPRLIQLMENAGYQAVERIDGAFFQPVLIGLRPA
ncbi:MAG: class I SAM-dependent methyltransferase [Acidobacteriota bacterium]